MEFTSAWEWECWFCPDKAHESWIDSLTLDERANVMVANAMNCLHESSELLNNEKD